MATATAPLARSLRVSAALAVVVIVAAAVWSGRLPGSSAELAAAGMLAAGAVGVGLTNPRIAVVYLLGAMMLRLVTEGMLPVDAFVLAYLGVVGALALCVSVGSDDLPAPGPVAAAMVLYLGWNVLSMLASHELPPEYLVKGEPIPVYRFILTGTAIPFTLYLVGRTVYRSQAAVRALLLVLVGVGAYSAWVSILQFYGPAALVWPRYVVDAPAWEGRANGLFSQPVSNGLAMIVSFLGGLLLGVHERSKWMRVAGRVVAAASVVGIQLTRTRAVWLAFALVIILGLVMVPRLRRSLAVTCSVVVIGVAVQWSTLTSTDRAAGGVGSENEVHDRLNIIATALWAAERKPLTGWGIGRFPAVNALHHQQYSPEIPWPRGYGIASHVNELGILAELGLIGLVLWLAVLVLVGWALHRAVRRAPSGLLAGHDFAAMAMLVFLATIVAGLTVDLRFLDYPPAIAMLLAGVAVGLAPAGPERRGDPAWTGARA